MIVISAPLIQVVSSLPTDTSALESSISALERAISALESQIKTLESSSVPWEHSVWLFTVLVAVGVAMELWVIRHDWRDDMEAWALAHFWGPRSPSRPSKTKLMVEIGSVLLITVGIVGELGVGIKITSINGILRGKSAELRSKNAELRQESDQLVALINDRAKGLEKEAAGLRNRNLELEGLIQPRDISPAEDAAITKSSESLRGKFVLLLEYQDPEAIRLGDLIVHALTGGAEYPHGTGPTVMKSPLQEGITDPIRTGVEITGDDQELVKALKIALFSIAHLEPCPRLARPRLFFGGVMRTPKPPRTPDATIYVGLKPLRFLSRN